jgi:hypothetical protein
VILLVSASWIARIIGRNFFRGVGRLILNSGLCTYKVHTLQIEPNLHSILL